MRVSRLVGHGPGRDADVTRNLTAVEAGIFAGEYICFHVPEGSLRLMPDELTRFHAFRAARRQLVLDETCCEIERLFRSEFPDGMCRGFSKEVGAMLNRSFTIACGVMLTLGMAGAVVAQGNGVQQPSAHQQLQRIHTPQSINQELLALRKILS